MDFGRIFRHVSTISDELSPLKRSAEIKRSFRLTLGIISCTLLILFLGALDLIQHYDQGITGALILSVIRILPIILIWRSRPAAGWWLSLVAITATALIAQPSSSSEPWPWAITSVFSQTLVLWLIAFQVRRQTAFIMWLITQIVGLALVVIRPSDSTWPGFLSMVVGTTVALFVADLMRGRSEVRKRLQRQEQISETERARRTVLEERTRVARELHDVVAHHMSVIVVQADSAPYRIPAMAPEISQEFRTIGETARESLSDMRRILDVLRCEEAERQPQPGLRQLPALIETTNRVGASTELAIDEALQQPDALSAALELAIYRITQEALSNVIRHAPGAHVQVTITQTQEMINVTIANSVGTASTVPFEESTGRGLVGMRERVAALGGQIHAGPQAAGGFLVAATLPIREAA
ncbi:MAG: sensor histidine kinase [Corynebacteriales bacterium]|nr:sensor histidine kinase [Mycobacteriales bacterium]